MIRSKAPRRLGLKMQLAGTLGCIAAYRLLCAVPLPFVDRTMINLLVSSGAVSMVDMLTGGNLSQMSVAALGISPYITASIFIQLFSVILPSLGQLQRSGAVGQKKIKRLTMLLSGLFAAFSAGVIVLGRWRSNGLTVMTWYAAAVPFVLMVFSALLLTRLGQLVDDKFFGNGISLFLLTGIVSSLPGQAKSAVSSVFAQWGTAGMVVFAVCVAAEFGFVYFLQMSKRDYPISFVSKIDGPKLQDDESVLSLRVLSSSVMPVIFASSVMAVPQVIQTFLGRTFDWMRIFRTDLWFSTSDPFASIGAAVYVCLIFFFTGYSQSTSLNEIEMADSLRAQGCVIEGVAPGAQTESFLRSQLRILNRMGAIALSIIAFLPIAAAQLAGVPSVSFLGTSSILIVSILTETCYSFATEHKSEGFIRCRQAMEFSSKRNDPFALLEKKVQV